MRAFFERYDLLLSPVLPVTSLDAGKKGWYIDLLTPPSHARRIAGEISTAEMITAPDAGHMLPLERDALVSATLVKLARPHLDR